MLSPDLIRKIKRIHIRCSKVVDTLFAGEYRSAFRGQGMEFEEVREYAPGDEVKSIDWKVTARMGRPFVKLYREERELNIMLLVDLSRSMGFGTREAFKREKAAEVAAVLAFSAIKNGDKVGAVLFTDKVESYLPPKKGAAHVWRVIKEIVDFKPEGRGTDVGQALEFLGRVMRKRSVSFAISDFLSPAFDRPLRLVSRRHDLISVVLSDPGDFSLPPAGFVEVRDLETGGRVVIDAGSAKVRRAYESSMKKRLSGVLQRCKSAGVDHVPISTQGSVAMELVRFFRSREARTR